MKKGTSSGHHANETEAVLKPSVKLKAEFNKKAAKPVSAGEILAPNAKRTLLPGKRYVLTAAQNNTEVNAGFLKALESYCKDNGAELLVSRFTYNKGGFDNSGQKDGELWYDPKLSKYICDKPMQIGKDLVFGGELDISPTASNPLSGFDNYFQGKSGVVPNPRVAMKSLPGLGEDNARFLYTTGAVTERNYIQKKAGQNAEFHHNYGALVVEVDENGHAFVRQLAADNSGMFQDLTNKYLPDGKIERNQPIEAITLGDIHVEKTDPVQDSVTFGKGGIMETLKPKYSFLQDIMDFTARNHHNMKDPFFWAEQKQKGNTVEGGFGTVAAWLKRHEQKGRQDIIVESNHDEAFDRWLKEQDVRFDPENARFWHEASAERYKQIESGQGDANIFEWAVRRAADLPNAVFLRENDSFIIGKNSEDGQGIECALHGHSGPNGARGSPKGFTQLATKANTGHTHTAGIIDGVYTAGVSGKLDMEYNKGPSSWSHSHVITYPNGKRAIITVKNGKWRADDKPHTAEAPLVPLIPKVEPSLKLPKPAPKLTVVK